MPGVKRAREDFNEEVEVDASQASTLEEALKRIHELEQQRDKLFAFIERRDLLLSLPQALLDVALSKPDGAIRLANALRDRIRNVHDENEADGDACAQEMSRLIPDVKRVAELPGGLDEGVKLWLDVGAGCVGDLDTKGGCGNGDCDDVLKVLDRCLIETAERQRMEHPVVFEANRSDLIRRIKRTGKWLGGYGIEEYFTEALVYFENPEAFDMEELKEWVEQEAEKETMARKTMYTRYWRNS